MKGNKLKKSANGGTNASAIAVGVVVAVLLSVLFSVVVTSLVLKNRLHESTVGAVVFIIRLISVLAGALVAGVIKKGRYLQITGITTLTYLIMLIALGVVMYDGSFHNFISGALSALLGGAVALLIQQRPKSGRHKTAKYSR